MTQRTWTITNNLKPFHENKVYLHDHWRIWGRGRTRLVSPLQPEIFLISCSFSENLAISYVDAPRTVGTPYYGESNDPPLMTEYIRLYCLYSHTFILWNKSESLYWCFYELFNGYMRGKWLTAILPIFTSQGVTLEVNLRERVTRMPPPSVNKVATRKKKGWLKRTNLFEFKVNMCAIQFTYWTD